MVCPRARGRRSYRYRTTSPPAGLSSRAGAPELDIDFETAVARLPPGMRRIFVLHDVEGYKHEEIAAMLGIAPGTSKSQLHRVRMMLRKYLDA